MAREPLQLQFLFDRTGILEHSEMSQGEDTCHVRVLFWYVLSI